MQSILRIKQRRSMTAQTPFVDFLNSFIRKEKLETAVTQRVPVEGLEGRAAGFLGRLSAR